jgi:tellurite resistance protein TehA-like permease
MSAPTPSAVVLIVVTICAGLVACVVGAAQGGVWGAGLGLLGTWVLFLLGLFGIYRRHHSAEPSAAPASEVEEAPRPVGNVDGY